MSDEHLDLRNALLERLERQTEETNKLMRQLMAEMDRARYSASTGQSEDFRRRFAELMQQQRQLAEKFTQQTAALGNPTSSTKQ